MKIYWSSGSVLCSEIEKACMRDLNFLWLPAGTKAPDHATIARFRSFYLSDACEDLFYQLILQLADMGEIPFEHIFIDGNETGALNRTMGSSNSCCVGKLR